MPKPITNAVRFLETLHRFDLARLISYSRIELDPGNGRRRRWGNAVMVYSPRPFSEAIDLLPAHDRQRIAEATIADDPDIPHHEDVSFGSLDEPAVEGPQTLIADLVIHREMLISVATGGQRIQEVDDYYKVRQRRLQQACEAASIPYQNPFEGLWDWYGYYSKTLPHYADRRQHIAGLFRSSIDAASMRTRPGIEDRPPTGWERVDRALATAKAHLLSGSAEEDYQAIGLLCREVIISLAQAVYDPAIHESVDGTVPSATDANRMLEAYVGHTFPGESYKEVRAHARAALALALNLQHRRTATRQLALLSLEATSSATAVIALIAGRAV